ncbi:F23F12.8 [Symbiodinium microadriaticum]|nr:F23F12.8 [Symbiodinium microadriaticum]
MLQAPTEESDYDPFAGANAAQAAHSAKNEKEYNPFEQAERDAAAAEELEPSSLDFLFLVRSMDDEEDEGAFESLIEAGTKMEQETISSGEVKLHSADMLGMGFERSVDPAPAPQAAQQPRPTDTGEEHFAKVKAKPKTEYHFNSATQRWEPKAARGDLHGRALGAFFKDLQAAPPSPPKPEPFRPGALAQTMSCNAKTAASVPAAALLQMMLCRRGRWHRKRRMRRLEGRLVIAECEAEARAALAVRLALRFESRPKDILVSMSEAGLPAAKDQRSTVKTIMRLCHPDKCKHPEAKRAMQILGPLLS